MKKVNKKINVLSSLIFTMWSLSLGSCLTSKHMAKSHQDDVYNSFAQTLPPEKNSLDQYIKPNTTPTPEDFNNAPNANAYPLSGQNPPANVTYNYIYTPWNGLSYWLQPGVSFYVGAGPVWPYLPSYWGGYPYGYYYLGPGGYYGIAPPYYNVNPFPSGGAVRSGQPAPIRAPNTPAPMGPQLRIPNMGNMGSSPGFNRGPSRVRWPGR